MKRKMISFLRYAGLPMLFLFISCVSRPETPEWIDRYPLDDKYFIGIGSSNDPVQSVAAVKARQNAIANLASSISTSIIAETEIATSEDSDGKQLQSVQRRVQENISQTLEGAEVFDSFYSIKQGYWIFIRIPKQQIERQKKELSKRIEELLVPLFSREELSAAEALALLQKSHALLLDSPYFASLSGELGDEKGILLDLIENKTAALLAVIRISVLPESLEGRGGQTADLSVLIQGELPAGNMPVTVRLDDELLDSAGTTADGQTALRIDFSKIPLGRETLTINLHLEDLGIRQSSYDLKLPSVSTGLPVHVLPLPLRFIMEYDEQIALPGIPEMASALFFSTGLPFSLAEENSDAEYTLRCMLIVEDFPRYRDNSLEISQARLIIQVEYQDQVLHTYQSTSMKDGGLTIAQAHERTIKKLFQKLSDEQEYLPGILKVLPIRVSR